MIKVFKNFLSSNKADIIEKDWATSEKAKAAKRFKEFRDLVTQDEFYISMRKEWRDKENVPISGPR